jgi:hypothetical protein
MLDDTQTLTFALALGIVISASTDGRRLAIIGVLLLAAPHIVICAAGRAMRRDEAAPAWLFGVFGLSSLWSFGLGFLALKLLIS